LGDWAGRRKNQFQRTIAIKETLTPDHQPPREEATTTGIRKSSGAV
jgi:hypothetical protein